MNVIVYCSQPASPQMATFLLAVEQAHTVAIRPVSELPAPDPLRRQALRAERVQLLASIQGKEAQLAKFHSGEWQPDAGHENGLRFDLNTLRNRLRGIEATLGLGEGGVDNA